MTRIEALRELSRWHMCSRGPCDRGFVRIADFAPRGFDVPIAEIRATVPSGHIAIETLITAIKTLVESGLPKPRPKRTGAKR